uniref:Uncharacterized protein n=1 Tax=Ignisphaera aggregans TaxID=334771 RepID=A0A7C5UWN3_9CREN
MDISRFVNYAMTLIIPILVLLIGIVAGYTITEKFFEIGIQTIYIIAIELTFLTILPIAIGFFIALLITRVGRGR